MKTIGIAGAGFIAYSHAEGIRLYDNVQLGGVAEIDPEKLEKITRIYGGKAYTDFEQMLADPAIDIIDICLPTPLHHSFALKAIAAGKAVLLEKPIALSYAEAKQIVDAARERRVPFMVGQSLRFSPAYAAARRIITGGEIGPVKQVYAARLGQRPSWRNWNNSAKKAGGVLYDLMLHDIDYLISLFGTVTSSYAAGRACADGGYEDIFAVLRFENGVNAVVDGSEMMPAGYPFTMILRVNGEKGTVEYRFVGGENTEVCRESLLTLYLDGEQPQLIPLEKDSSHGRELSYFADCIEKGVEPDACHPDETLRVMQVLEDIAAKVSE